MQIMIGEYCEAIEDGALSIPAPWLKDQLWAQPHCRKLEGEGRALVITPEGEDSETLLVENGMLNLNDALQTYLGTKGVVLVGIGKAAELWPAEAWEARRERCVEQAESAMDHLLAGLF